MKVKATTGTLAAVMLGEWIINDTVEIACHCRNRFCFYKCYGLYDLPKQSKQSISDLAFNTFADALKEVSVYLNCD